MEYTKKQKLKIYYNYILYYFYKLIRMEEYFLKRQEQIDALTKDLEDKKYTKLCFIDLIDAGSTFSVDIYGCSINIKKDVEPSDYKSKAAYLVKLAATYDQINECVDKVKIRYEPFSVDVKVINSENIRIIVDTLKGRKEEEKKKSESTNGSRRYSGSYY